MLSGGGEFRSCFDTWHTGVQYVYRNHAKWIRLLCTPRMNCDDRNNCQIRNNAEGRGPRPTVKQTERGSAEDNGDKEARRSQHIKPLVCPASVLIGPTIDSWSSSSDDLPRLGAFSIITKLRGKCICSDQKHIKRICWNAPWYCTLDQDRCPGPAIGT